MSIATGGNVVVGGMGMRAGTVNLGEAAVQVTSIMRGAVIVGSVVLAALAPGGVRGDMGVRGDVKRDEVGPVDRALRVPILDTGAVDAAFAADLDPLVDPRVGPQFGPIVSPFLDPRPDAPLAAAGLPAAPNSFAFTQGEDGIEVEAELGGEVSAVQSVGSLLYVAVGRRIVVIDPASPGRDATDTGILLPLPVHAMDALGDRLVAITGVIRGRATLEVIDIAVPTQPVHLGGVSLPRFALEVALDAAVPDGAQAWLAMGSDGLWRADLRDPRVPRVAPQWRPPDASGEKQSVAGVIRADEGVAALVGPARSGAIPMQPVQMVHWLRMDDEGRAAQEVGRQSLGASYPIWHRAPGYLVYANSLMLHAMPIRRAEDAQRSSAIRLPGGLYLAATVVGEHVMVAYTLTADWSLRVAIHALSDGKELRTERVEEIDASGWKLLAEHDESLVMGAWDALHLRSGGAGLGDVSMWPVSLGRYVAIERFGDGWLVLSDGGELQFMDMDGRVVERGLVDQPLKRFAVMGDRLVGSTLVGEYFHVLERRDEGQAGSKWQLGSRLPIPRLNREDRFAASNDLLAVWSAHERQIQAARWVDGTLTLFPQALRGSPPAFLVEGDEVWVANNGGSPVRVYRWNDVGPPRITGQVGLRAIFAATTLAQSGRFVLLGDSTGQIIQVDMLTLIGQLDWRLDMPAAIDQLARYKSQGWATWGGTQPGLAAIACGRTEGMPLGSIGLNGVPKALAARDGHLWVIQESGALTRYRYPGANVVRAPSATPTATTTAPPTATMARTPTAVATATATRSPALATAAARRAGWADGRTIALPIARREP